MNNVVVSWVNGSSESFEKNIPLEWCGRRNLKLGSKNPLTVLFLDGFDRLNCEYTCSLRNIGYTLVDCGKVYSDLEVKYNVLSRFGDFEKKCFLRWLVIREVFGEDKVLHYDGDIVFNEIPEVLGEKIGDFAFVLQGCPAIVSTGKSDWLVEYKKNLDYFVKNIDAYSVSAWNERRGWEQSYLNKWSGSRFREVISSDQDFISHLIHTDRLPQTSPETVMSYAGDLVFFENLLEFDEFYPEMLPVKYERITSVDYFNGKKIAIWHMQSYFVKYLRCFLAMGFLNKHARCANFLKEKTFFYYVWVFLDSILLRRKQERLAIYDYFFEKKDFSGIFNDHSYWKKKIFI